MGACDEPMPRSASTESPAARVRTGWSGRLWPAWLVAGWFTVVVLGWLSVTWALRIEYPVWLTVPLHSLAPLAFLPIYVVLGTAVWRRRRALAIAAGLLAVVHVALLWPAIGSRTPPAWASSAPRITVLSANVYDGNRNPAAAASMLVGAPADVLVLVEITRGFQDALDAAGIDREFPYNERNEFDADAHSVEVIYSRVPIRSGTILQLADGGMPTAVLATGTVSVRVVGVHIIGPLHDVGEWRRQLADIDAFARDERGPLVVAGDFNATRWNPEYGQLLGNGLVDAVESTGRGLSFSWPVSRLLPFPVMRLDHALGNSRVAVVECHDITIPGSDHRGLVTTWAIRGDQA